MTRTDPALLVLRLAPGAALAAHGLDKVTGGHDAAVALFMTVGLPAPEALAWVVGALEVGAGACLLAGLLTRLAGAYLAVEMAVAIWAVVRPRGFLGGYEYEAALLAVALALVLAGGGSLSLDALAQRRRSRQDAVARPENSRAVYAVAYEYVVPAGGEDAFERVYGPGGEWARFFRAAEGYLGTDLYRDPDGPGRYLLIDRWASRGAADTFLAAHAAAYESRCRQTRPLYERETRLSAFVAVGHPGP